MAKPPTTKRAPRVAAATPTAEVPPIAPETPSADIPGTAEPAPATAIHHELADGDTIRMLTGQEGPTLSRVYGQLLTIGADLDAAEAQRLIDADFAERA